MLTELILVLGTLGVVIAGMLVMLGVFSFEDLLGAIGRFFAFLLGLAAALCVFRMVVATVVVPWLLSLRAFLGPLVLGLLVVIALTVIAGLSFSKFQDRAARSGNSDQGES